MCGLAPAHGAQVILHGSCSEQKLPTTQLQPLQVCLLQVARLAVPPVQLPQLRWLLDLEALLVLGAL